MAKAAAPDKNDKVKGELTVLVRCVGYKPLLMNPATQQLLDDLEAPKGARKATRTDQTSYQKAEGKIIKDDDGNVGLPADYLFACLREAGRQIIWKGKSKISTADATVLPGLMQIKETFLPFENQEAPWEVDRRKGSLPKDGVAVCVTRPRFNEWSFMVTIVIDQQEIEEGKVKELFRVAGRFIGLADFRKKGDFGRFRVDGWEQILPA